MWIPFARLHRQKRNPSLWQLMKLYELNHIGKTFGITLEEFTRAPWQYLGKPSPEIQQLWDRPHQLLPQQLEIAFGDQHRVAHDPVLAPGGAPKRRRTG
jgi:hypothetical protein